MTSFDAPALPALAVVAAAGVPFLARRSGRDRMVGAVVVAGAVAIPVAGHLAVLAGAWLAAGVASCQSAEEHRRAAAWAFLGDVVAVAAFTALAVDTGEYGLPWEGGAAPTPWAFAMVAGGVGLRSAAGGGLHPVMVAAGAMAALRLVGVGLPPDLGWMVVVAPVGVAAAWAGRTAGAVALFGLGALGVDPPVGASAGAVLLVGAALTAVAQAALTAPVHDPLEWPRRRVAALLRRGPAEAAEGAGSVALVAVVPGAVVLGQAAVARDAAMAVAGASLLAGVALLARAEPAPVAQRWVRAWVVVAGALAVSALFAPGVWWDALGVDLPLPEAVERARRGVVAAGAFGLGGVGLVTLLGRLGRVRMGRS